MSSAENKVQTVVTSSLLKTNEVIIACFNFSIALFFSIVSIYATTLHAEYMGFSFTVQLVTIK